MAGMGEEKDENQKAAWRPAGIRSPGACGGHGAWRMAAGKKLCFLNAKNTFFKVFPLLISSSIKIKVFAEFKILVCKKFSEIFIYCCGA